MFLKLLTCLLPWSLKRKALQKWFGFKIHRQAYIGLAWVFPQELIMSEGSSIDHFTVAIHLDSIEMGLKSTIGRNNWITGFSTSDNSPHFRHQENRRAQLIIGDYANITKHHHLDCTNLIHVGRFATIAGYYSQFLTHSIDILENRQSSEPILIGEYTFVGTNVVVLGGAQLPSFSVLGAKSLLNKAHSNEWTLYGGVPATALRDIPKSAKYFSRADGFVY